MWDGSFWNHSNYPCIYLTSGIKIFVTVYLPWNEYSVLLQKDTPKNVFNSGSSYPWVKKTNRTKTQARIMEEKRLESSVIILGKTIS